MKLTQLHEKLADACKRHHIPTPSYAQIRRLLLAAPKDLQSFLKNDYDTFYEDDCLKARRQYGYPLELVQMDSANLDIYVMDPISGELYRPWFTAGIDLFTRVIPGYYLHREAPSEQTSVATLKRMILPSGRDDQPFFGQMEKITVDQHGSNVAKHLKSQMVHLGVNYVANDPRCSDQNGGIERWFRTIQEGLLATLPGYTNQPDAMARAKRGCLTFPMLEKQIGRWLLKYHMATHSALKCSPWDMWKTHEDIAHGQIFDMDAVKAACRIRHESKVLTDGVHLPDGRIFSGPILNGMVGERVIVLFDPEAPEHELECYFDGKNIGKIKDVTVDPAMAKQINVVRLKQTKELRKFRKRLSGILKKSPLPEEPDVRKVKKGDKKERGSQKTSRITAWDTPEVVRMEEE